MRPRCLRDNRYAVASSTQSRVTKSQNASPA
jgi:hypothetical protein